MSRLAEKDNADAVFFQIERDPEEPAAERQHFAQHGAREAADTGDPVADGNDVSDLRVVEAAAVGADSVANRCGDEFSARGSIHGLKTALFSARDFSAARRVSSFSFFCRAISRRGAS